ncbi:MAG: GNAT family N-acetyltransferase [Actinomycetota bacterium]|nr:GNAT family N-acetyltransferase [Actinomycetota bacterium]
MESVRPAEPADLARCAELIAAARTHARSRRGGDLAEAFGLGHATCSNNSAATDRSDVDPWDSVLGWQDGDPDRSLFAGIFDGVVVGLAAGRVTTSRAARRLGQIAVCYVEPGARGVGVGTLLVEELLAWFRSRGCTHVDGLALPGDRETKQLYEEAGFKARLVVLNRQLD